MNFVSFPDIGSFFNVVKTVEAFPPAASNGILSQGIVPYRGKIKLHGTNAGIRIKDKVVMPQSRTNFISVEKDNAGFARWLEDKKDFFFKMPDNTTIFGEWCGSGIMKGTALNQLKCKIFVVFAIVLGDKIPLDGEADTREFIHSPEILEETLNGHPDDVFILPWHDEAFDVNFNNRNNLLQTADKLNAVVASVEPLDPWVKTVFGVEGTGEGLVYYPFPDALKIKRYQFSNLAFKAKGEKHKVVKTKNSVQIDPEVASSIDEFVAMFVTEARLEQGLNATGGKADVKNISVFLKWFAQDVLKESVAELEASELTWDQVVKSVQNLARNWYLAKTRNL